MTRPKTHKGDEERIAIGAAERRRPQAYPIVTASEDDTSPHQTDEERQVIRRKRPTQERIEKLEVKHDDLAKAVHAVALSHAELKGGMGTLIDYAKASEVEREKRSAADAKALDARRKHMIALIGALAAGAAIVIAAMAQGCL